LHGPGPRPKGGQDRSPSWRADVLHIRPLSGTNGGYEFVGDAYCEDLMQGEALADPQLVDKVGDLTIV
jgi:hypothetical protein